jgi:glucose-1-phosphate adenylyltransferase
MAYVLAGGRGSRLVELTDKRAKPAVYFGGKSRIIDFALSNALNSGIRRIGVAVQYKAHSLIRHLQLGWGFLSSGRNESLDILPAGQFADQGQWYLGTADAVFQNIDIIRGYKPRFVVVLAGDHVYKMDYEAMLQQHVERGADVTVACVEVPIAEASGFGVMHVDADDRVISFLEKPKDPPSLPGKPGRALASMGIYVFDTDRLIEELRRDAADRRSRRDFGGDIIPHLVEHGLVVAHRFERSCVRGGLETEPYWRDVGTLDAYWQTNIDLTAPVPSLDLYAEGWPIWTYAENRPPARFTPGPGGTGGDAVNSLVSGGCVVEGATVQRSVLFSGTKVAPGAHLDGAVVLPDVLVGRGARLKRTVVDRGVRIPDGLVIGDDPKSDAQRFRRSAQGVCLVTQTMIDRLQE